MWVGSCVLHPGSAAQLKEERIVCVFKTYGSVSNIFCENLLTRLQKSDGTSEVKIVFLCFRLRNGINTTFAPFFKCFACPENIIKELSDIVCCFGPQFFKDYIWNL